MAWCQSLLPPVTYRSRANIAPSALLHLIVDSFSLAGSLPKVDRCEKGSNRAGVPGWVFAEDEVASVRDLRELASRNHGL